MPDDRPVDALSAHLIDDNPTAALLEAEHASAERALNRVRLGVLALLGVAAALYSVNLPQALTAVNAAVLVPMLAWTLFQHFSVHRKGARWRHLSTFNAVLDITAITALLFGYGLAGNADLAVKSPVWVAYCAILAARPFTGSPTGAALATTVAVLQYAFVGAYFTTAGDLALWGTPLESSRLSGTSLFDEGAKLLLLAIVGGVATYATAWAERAMRRAVGALRTTEARFRAIFDHSAAGIALLDPQGTIIEANTALHAFLGYEGDGIRGRPASTFLPAEDAETARLIKSEVVRGTRQSATHEYRFVRRDGQLSWGTLTVSRASAGGATRLIAIVQDVTERKRLEAQLAHQAYHDPLTELANRTLFRDRVEHALARASRHCERVAVLFLDVDDFKTVNDSLGHDEGDRLLKAVAARLLNATRGCDTVARLGGDEFAVLLENVRDDQDAIVVANRVTSALSAPFQLNQKMVSVGASMGIARAADGDGADELLRNADVAMYAAKSRGKGRYCVFAPEMHAALLTRLSTEADLYEAVERKEFRLMYQPIVDLEAGRMVGCEALVRWDHPQRGLIAPDSFIRLAEDTGLIIPLGRWVLREATREAMTWPLSPTGARPPYVTVNIAGKQLLHPEFVSDVASSLHDSGLTADRLILEITEGTLLDNAEATTHRLQELKSLGVRLAIDDFGTGYSSLSYLQRFPIDILKIDKSFVDGIVRGGNQAALARTIISLGDSLALRTVAEGIETDAQRSVLRELGCQLGQGFFYARPLEPSAISGAMGRLGLGEEPQLAAHVKKAS
ncbi:MAG TPA: EAL domain-containing protein [Gemmatimonadaceae bacterium]|nr:EAL domain-containing protein [Gemmatimonadaceae bacterium]